MSLQQSCQIFTRARIHLKKPFCAHPQAAAPHLGEFYREIAAVQPHLQAPPLVETLTVSTTPAVTPLLKSWAPWSHPWGLESIFSKLLFGRNSSGKDSPFWVPQVTIMVRWYFDLSPWSTNVLWGTQNGESFPEGFQFTLSRSRRGITVYNSSNQP